MVDMSKDEPIEVRMPKDIPDGPHYVILEFDKVTESSGWGSENDSQVLRLRYYAFKTRNAWELMAREFAAKRRQPGYNRGNDFAAFFVQAKAEIASIVQIQISSVVTPGDSNG